jgi:uncharacterized protein (TIGR02646 family)
MKPLLRAAPEAFEPLDRFRAEQPAATWDDFRAFELGAGYQSIRAALVAAQGGLCAYCEIRFPPGIGGLWVQVEHVVEKSLSEHETGGPNLHLAAENLVASCTGGAQRTLAKPEALDEAQRWYMQPLPENLSCGQAKERHKGAALIDPRDLSAGLMPIACNMLGELVVNEADARAAGLAKTDLESTLEILGLNCPRLVYARLAAWMDVEEEFEDFDELDWDPDRFEAYCALYLAPDEDGRLVEFWTTVRSCLGQAIPV